MEGGILMLTLKQLVDKENAEMKERRKTESSGCYFVFYILVAACILLSAFTAFLDNNDLYFIYTVAFMEFTSVYLLYGYIPVDINQLFLAKIILLGKKLILIILPAQIVAFITRIIYIFTDGGKFFNIFLFTPSISGIIIFLIFSIIIYNCKQAVK